MARRRSSESLKRGSRRPPVYSGENLTYGEDTGGQVCPLCRDRCLNRLYLADMLRGFEAINEESGVDRSRKSVPPFRWMKA